MIKLISKWLNGKKTYIVLVVGIISVLVGWWDGDISAVEAWSAIWAALTAAGLRSAIG